MVRAGMPEAENHTREQGERPAIACVTLSLRDSSRHHPRASDPQRTLSKTVGGSGRLGPALTESDSVLFGGEERTENRPPRAQCCSVGATQKLLKEELGPDSRLGRDLVLPCVCTHAHQLCQQRTQGDRVLLKALWDGT